MHVCGEYMCACDTCVSVEGYMCTCLCEVCVCVIHVCMCGVTCVHVCGGDICAYVGGTCVHVCVGLHVCMFMEARGDFRWVLS